MNIKSKFKSKDEDWNDYIWQLKNSVTTTKELLDLGVPLTPSQVKDIDSCLSKFQMRITPYYLSLIDFENPLDPIRMQSIPMKEELIVENWEMNDPLNEEEQSPVENLVHRYPDRVLFLVSNQCSMYCRHCTRKRFAGNCSKSPVISQYKEAFEYIKSHKEVRDVLLSGGDPFLLPDSTLKYIISNLRDIPHVEIIRIGTRTPVVLPQRITPELCTMLSQYHPIWINTHFNHPKELTKEAVEACSKLANVGIPIGNQSVLLRGVNDSVEVMKELLHKLVKARVRPYYLYQCDLSYGLSHFRTPVQTGIDIIKGLRGFTSGYCIPQFVIDAPNGGGKVPINPNYIKNWGDDKITFVNYEGDSYEYPTK